MNKQEKQLLLIMDRYITSVKKCRPIITKIHLDKDQYSVYEGLIGRHGTKINKDGTYYGFEIIKR